MGENDKHIVKFFFRWLRSMTTMMIILALHCSCYQKSMERLERLSLVLHIFKTCSRRLFGLVDNVHSFGGLNDEFKIICADVELEEVDSIIDYDTCYRASLLTKFYLNQTKILAGYDPISDNILSNKKSK